MTTSTKKTATKAATKKRANPVKAVGKKDAATKSATKVELSPDSNIRVVAGSKEPTRPERKAIKKSVPSGGIAAKDLCAKAECRMTTLAAMIRRGFLEVRA